MGRACPTPIPRPSCIHRRVTDWSNVNNHLVILRKRQMSPTSLRAFHCVGLWKYPEWDVFGFRCYRRSITKTPYKIRDTRSAQKITEHFELSVLVTYNWQHCVRHNFPSNQKLYYYCCKVFQHRRRLLMA